MKKKKKKKKNCICTKVLWSPTKWDGKEQSYKEPPFKGRRRRLAVRVCYKSFPRPVEDARPSVGVTL